MNYILTKLLIPVLLCAALMVVGEQALSASGAAPICNQAQLQRGCLYFPAVHYTALSIITDTLTYTDAAGLTRTVPIALRIPLTAPVPLPVVIWSHGGATGHTNPLTSMAEWSETTAAAGYLTISIAHLPRTGTRQALCAAIATTVPGNQWPLADPQTCANFKYLNWDRPYDIRAVLDELERRNRHGPLQGRVDLAHIAVGGHSAGAGGALVS